MVNPAEPSIHLTVLQFAAATAAAVSFLAAFWLEFQALGRQQMASGPGGGPDRSNGWLSPNIAVGNGVFLTALLMASRMVYAHRLTLPLSDYFDAFLLLALVLSLLWAYLQWTRHLRALATFLPPISAVR